MEYEEALLIGGPRDGERIDTYPGQGTVKMPRLADYVPGDALDVVLYRLHRVHDSRGFHRLIGLLEGDHRGPMQALYEGYKKEKENA